MTPYRFASLLALALWLAGCNTLARFDVAAEPPAGAGARPAASSVDADIVYGALAGHIAAQRGEYAEAHRQYQFAARLSRSPGLAELATKAALAAQDRDAARAAVQTWLEFNPQTLPGLQISALLYAQQGRQDRAVEELRRLVELRRRGGGDGYLDVARLLAKVADAGLRLDLMRRLAAGRETDAEALFALALVEAGAGQPGAAERAVRQVLALRPGWDEAQVLLVRTLAAQSRLPEARVALERFLADSPDDIKLRGAYARLLVEQEDLPAAQTQFLLLLRQRPDDADSLFALGILALQLDQPELAKKYLEQVYALGGHRDDAAFYLGQIYEAEQAPEPAMEWYDRVEADKLFEARVRIARLRADAGEVERAREILQQLRGQAGKGVAQIDLVEAELLRDLKQHQAALEVLTRALQREPDNEDLLYTRALTAVAVDRIDILETDLRAILARDPDHADALNALGYTLADRTDRLQEALGYIERALALKPDSPAVLDSMGWIQYRLGRPGEALRYLWRAMELLPDAEIASHLGEVLWVRGERERARQVWREALEREPGSTYILRVMERFGERPGPSR
jgi:tetratricopeptide (TPR) repeat protein